MGLQPRSERLLWGLALGLFFAGAWRLLPRTVETGNAPAPLLRVALVDASASVVRTRPDWLPWVRTALASLAREAEGAGAEVAVVAFAEEVAVCVPPGPASGLLAALEGRSGRPLDPRSFVGDGAASALADGLALAGTLAQDPTRRGGELWYLGDGSFTGSDPGPALERLLARGLGWRELAPPAPSLDDLALLAFELPTEHERDAPLVVNAELDWRPAARGSENTAELIVAITNEADGLRREERRTLRLPAVGGPFRVVLALGTAGSGRTRLVAWVRLAGGSDPIPENDRLETTTRAAGTALLGVVSTGAREPEARSWLASEEGSNLPGLQFLFLRPEELGPALSELDAVVTYDVPLGNLPGLLLSRFVRTGGGLLTTVGWDALGSLVPDEVPRGVAALLPLRPANQESRPRDVVLLVDGSGSMDGAPFEAVRSAALDLVGGSLPSDRVTLRFFRTGLEEPNLIKGRERVAGDENTAREAAEGLLALRVPDGTTYILNTLERFAELEYEGDVLALLLTDGYELDHRANTSTVSGRALFEALRERLHTSHRRLVVVGVGPDPDLDYLSHLVPDGEHVLRAGGLEDMRAIFRQAMGQGRLKEGVLNARALPLPAGGLGASVWGAPVPALPGLQRLWLARAREGAEVLFEEGEGEPLLALWRLGLGRVASFASLPGAGWAPGWSRPGWGEPSEFGPLLRFLARGTRRAEEGPRLSWNQGQLTLTGLEGDWPLSVAARLVDGAPRDGDPVLALVPGLSGVRDPRRERRGVLAREEIHARRHPLLEIADPDPAREPWLFPLVAGRSPEFAAQAGGWLRLPAAAQPPALRTSRVSLRAGAEGPWLLGLGLLVLAGLAVLVRFGGQGFPGRDR